MDAKDPDDQALPRSKWDFSIYELNDKSSGFAYFGASTLYTGFFGGSTGNGSKPTVAIVSGGYTIGYAPTSRASPVESAEGVTTDSISVANVTAAPVGARLTYPGALGASVDVEYLVGWNGLKEVFRLKEAPPGSGDLTIHGTLFYDTSNLSVFVDGVGVNDTASTKGEVEFRNSTGDAVIAIPRGWAKDSSTARVMREGGSSAAAPAARWSEVTYALKRYGAVTYFDVIVPASFLYDPKTTYPVEVDPSLGPTIGDSQEYNFETIQQTSDLTILGGGTLVLRNSTFTWMGAYSLTVENGGTLILDNTTMDADTGVENYQLLFYGDAELWNSVIKGKPGWYDVNPPASRRHKIIDTNISGSLGDCITVTGATTPFTMSGSTVFGCAGAGVVFQAGGTYAHTWNITNSRFNDSLYGVVVQEGNYSAAVFDSDTFEHNRIDGFRADNATAKVTNCFAYRNARGWASVNGANLNVTSCTGEGNAVGGYAVGGFLNLTFVNITNSSVWDLYCVATSNCTASGGNYDAWVTVIQNSTLTYRHELRLRIVNAGGVAYSQFRVYVEDRYGNPAAPESKTNATGIVDLFVSDRRIQPDASITFYTPHTIHLGIAPQYNLTSVIDSDWNLSLYATGDADNDTILDAIENERTAYWFEASNHLLSASQRDLSMATLGAAAQRHDTDEFVKNDTFPDLRDGTYQLSLEAWTNTTGANLSVSVANETGVFLLLPTTFALSASHSWYKSAAFNTTVGCRPFISVRDADHLSKGAVLVGAIVLARIRNETDVNTTSRPGQLTNPIWADTDSDGAPDALERRNESFWEEAESIAVQSFDRVLSGAALSGAAAEHADGSGLIVDEGFDGLTEGNVFELWVRARTPTANSGARLELALVTEGATATSTAALTENFTWYRGPNWTADSSGGVSIRLTDLDDPDFDAGENWATVDAILLADLHNSNPFSLFSDPLQRDTDFDGLLDGPELGGFFTADFVNASEAELSQTTELVGKAARFNESQDWLNVSVPVRYDGDYRFYIPPEIYAADGTEQATLNATRALLLATLSDGNNHDIPADINFSNIYLGSSSPQLTDDSLTKLEGWYSWVYRNLTVGTYQLKVFVNASAAASLLRFAVYIDRIYVQKRTLDTLDTDFENDDVLDGLEVARTTFPLNPDSDYDHLTDAEEIFPWADGFETNPREPDTDGDGLWDAKEVSLWNDSDVATQTNPTDPDTDGDGLPDGWVDGWSYGRDVEGESPAIALKDGKKQPWEGEDLNLDGAWDSSAFSINRENASQSNGGETDPNLADTDEDEMPDGWELWVRDFNTSMYQWGNDPLVLNPRWNDSDGDSDVNRSTYLSNPDDLTNLQEYLSLTAPFFADTDQDFIVDGDEANVTLRTNVRLGFRDSTEFRNVTASSWVYFDRNPYDQVVGAAYWWNATEHNTTENYAGSLFFGGKLIKTIPDGGAILYNPTLNRIYVWEAGSEYAYTGSDQYHNGTAYQFVPGNSSGVNIASHTQRGFLGQEFLGDVNPLVRDSEGDGIIDGYDGPVQNNWTRWFEDRDADWLVNALDDDSDADGLPDGAESPAGGPEFRPDLGQTNAYAPDTDHDGSTDPNDTMPADFDNDLETGYGSFSDGWGAWPNFTGAEGAYFNAILNRTLAWDNADTDGDGIKDGAEDFDRDGHFDAGETNALDVDTDDDGLFDGPDVYYGSTTTVEAESGFGNSSGVFVQSGGSASGGSYLNWTGYLENISFTLNLSAAYYRLELAVADDNSPSNTTILGKNVTVEVYLDGVLLNVSMITVPPTVHLPSVSLFAVSPLPIWNASSHVLNIIVVRGDQDYRFHLDYLNFSSFHPGEWNASSSALTADTEGDGVQDGAERGLVAAITQTNTSSALGTDPAKLVEPPYLGLSWASSNDTDGDGLVDGSTRLVSTIILQAEAAQYQWNTQSYSSSGVVGLTTKTTSETGDTSWASIGYRVFLEAGYYEAVGNLSSPGCHPVTCTTWNYRASIVIENISVGRGSFSVPAGGPWIEAQLGAFFIPARGYYNFDFREWYESDLNYGFTIDRFILKRYDVGEFSFGTNPSMGDTDRDLVRDAVEIFRQSDPKVPDADGDGIPDAIEAPFSFDYDGDSNASQANGRLDSADARDTDRDNDSVPDGNATESTVVFRTNASRGMYNETGVWVAVDINDNRTLSTFLYDAAIPINYANVTNISFWTQLGNATRHASTPEGYLLFKNGSYVYIDMPGATDVRLVASTTGVPSDATTITTNPSYMMALRESLNWSLTLSTDADNDGLPDHGEPSGCLDNPDCDGDGVIDGIEAANGWIVTNPDSDSDGLWDGENITVAGEFHAGEGAWGSNPSMNDTDLDGLWDGWNTTVGGGTHRGELNYSTDSTRWDTDGDGMPDGWEIIHAFNATNATDGAADSDRDGMSNALEYSYGRPADCAPVPASIRPGLHELSLNNEGTICLSWEEANGEWPNGTNVSSWDSDGDAIPDGWEYRNGLSPLNGSDASSNVDGDGLNATAEYRLGRPIDWSEVTQGSYWNGSNPQTGDTDRDGIEDGVESANPSADVDGDGINNWRDLDADGDGLNDSIEHGGWSVGLAAWTYWYSIAGVNRSTNDGRQVTSSAYAVDTDGDGRGDLWEYAHGSDPTSGDTDVDGINESADDDPTHPESEPPSILGIVVTTVKECLQGSCEWWDVGASMSALYGWDIVVHVHDNAGVRRVEGYSDKINMSSNCTYARIPGLFRDVNCTLHYRLPLTGGSQSFSRNRWAQGFVFHALDFNGNKASGAAVVGDLIWITSLLAQVVGFGDPFEAGLICGAAEGALVFFADGAAAGVPLVEFLLTDGQRGEIGGMVKGMFSMMTDFLYNPFDYLASMVVTTVLMETQYLNPFTASDGDKAALESARMGSPGNLTGLLWNATKYAICKIRSGGTCTTYPKQSDWAMFSAAHAGTMVAVEMILFVLTTYAMAKTFLHATEIMPRASGASDFSTANGPRVDWSKARDEFGEAQYPTVRDNTLSLREDGVRIDRSVIKAEGEKLGAGRDRTGQRTLDEQNAGAGALPEWLFEKVGSGDTAPLQVKPEHQGAYDGAMELSSRFAWSEIRGALEIAREYPGFWKDGIAGRANRGQLETWAKTYAERIKAGTSPEELRITVDAGEVLTPTNIPGSYSVGLFDASGNLVGMKQLAFEITPREMPDGSPTQTMAYVRTPDGKGHYLPDSYYDLGQQMPFETVEQIMTKPKPGQGGQQIGIAREWIAMDVMMDRCPTCTVTFRNGVAARGYDVKGVSITAHEALFDGPSQLSDWKSSRVAVNTIVVDLRELAISATDSLDSLPVEITDLRINQYSPEFQSKWASGGRNDLIRDLMARWDEVGGGGGWALVDEGPTGIGLRNGQERTFHLSFDLGDLWF